MEIRAGGPVASDELAATYDTVAASYAALLPDTSFEGAVELAMIADLVAGAGDGARVLDAGCGTGRMLTHLHGLSPGLRLSGCDLSAEMVRIARESHPQVPLVRASIADLPHPSASFDAVLAWYSIIHTPPEGLPATLAELLRVLTPGGQLLLGFHSADSRNADSRNAESHSADSSGAEVRIAEGAYGHPVRLEVQLHPVARIVSALQDAGAEITAVLDRAARPGLERNPQGFVLATLPTAAA